MCKDVILWNLTFIFSGSEKKFSLVVLQITLQPLKNVKKNVICLKLFWYKAFVDWKLKLLNFLVDSISVLNVLEITFMFSHSNHLMIFTIAFDPRQFIHICLIKLDFPSAFDPAISHNLNSYQGPLFWSSLYKHLSTVCIVTSLSNLKFTVESVECEL